MRSSLYEKLTHMAHNSFKLFYSVLLCRCVAVNNQWKHGNAVQLDIRQGKGSSETCNILVRVPKCRAGVPSSMWLNVWVYKGDQLNSNTLVHFDVLSLDTDWIDIPQFARNASRTFIGTMICSESRHVPETLVDTILMFGQLPKRKWLSGAVCFCFVSRFFNRNSCNLGVHARLFVVSIYCVQTDCAEQSTPGWGIFVTTTFLTQEFLMNE